MPPADYPNDFLFTLGGTLLGQNYRQGADAADLCVAARFLWGLAPLHVYQGLTADGSGLLLHMHAPVERPARLLLFNGSGRLTRVSAP